MNAQEQPHFDVATETQASPDDSSLSMVEWYAPDQLIKTAKEVIVSGLFSHHADRKAFYTEWQKPKAFSVALSTQTMTGLDGKTSALSDFHDGNVTVNSLDDSIWLDYVADSGDGGNSTYTVANLLLNPSTVKYCHDNSAQLSQQDLDGIQAVYGGKLPRGDLLVLGGDLVYPIASEENYQQFFINHFKNALPKTVQMNLPLKERTHAESVLFAFPQNHDWYDSLASFSTLFCHKERDVFLDMYCPQAQSYAAVRLPHDWWLFGLDFGLLDDIDDLQFEYFKRIIEGNGDQQGGLTEKSNVILHYPTPYWVFEASGVPKTLASYRFEDLEKLIEKTIGKDIAIRIAGDQHHYRRYSNEKGDGHLITCGTGGAFLHPTHSSEQMNTIYHERDLTGVIPNRRFAHECDDKTHSCRKYTTNNQQAFPSPDISFRLSLGNLKEFFVRNILFGLFGLFSTDIKLLYQQVKQQKRLSDKMHYLNGQYKFRFGLLTAITYFLVVWLNFVCLHTDLNSAHIDSLFFTYNGTAKSIFDLNFANYFQAFELWCWAFLMSPLNMLLIVGMIWNFGSFAKTFNTHASTLSFMLGILHGIVHFVMIFTCYWLVIYLIDWPNHLDPVNDNIKLSRFVSVGIWIYIMGDVFGTLIMAWYLFLTVNLHRWFKNFPLLHFNEAFSSLSIEDYKGILKLRISQDKLEAFFIGVKKVPKKWASIQPGISNEPTWLPMDGEIEAELIDYWTVKTDSKRNA